MATVEAFEPETGQPRSMFDALKRLIGSSPSSDDAGQVLAAWAKSEGHALKRVNDKSGGGYVVSSQAGWRVEWGASQRMYIPGQELRFRCDTGLSGDVQFIMVTKVLAQMLESDVFARYTNAMQTQIDNSLPDEMRWLAMHQRVPLSPGTVLAKRFALVGNAEQVARAWLDDPMLAAFENAAATWWTDGLMLVLTVNRGIVTLRMAGKPLETMQLKMVSQLFAQIADRLKQIA